MVVLPPPVPPRANKIGSNKGARGRGRPKGAPNKNTAAVKEMILAALTKVGGVDYLAAQAAENPGPFMALLGKVMPLQVTDGEGGPIQVVIQRFADDAD